MLGVLPKLTREYIFSFKSPEEIFSHYTGIDVEEIQRAIKYKEAIHSPIGKDRNPSAGFYYSDDRLRMQDFRGYFHGDCWDYVGYLELLDADDPAEHNKILHLVAQEFLLHQYAPEPAKQGKSRPLVTTPRRGKLFTEIAVGRREWNNVDKQIWYDRYRLLIDTLDTWKTYPAGAVGVNRQIIYYYDQYDPAYGYYIGPYDNKHHWKVYWILRPKGTPGRFIMNSRKLDGLHLVTHSPYGVIVKARKDAMILWQMGIPVVVFAAEGLIPTVKEMNFLRKYWKKIYTLTDFDRIGVRTGNAMRRIYKTTPLFLTTGKANTLNFGHTHSEKFDFADYTEYWGYDQGLELVEYLKEFGTDNDRDFSEFIIQLHG